jgi:hypothetical protein
VQIEVWERKEAERAHLRFGGTRTTTLAEPGLSLLGLILLVWVRSVLHVVLCRGDCECMCVKIPRNLPYTWTFLYSSDKNK